MASSTMSTSDPSTSNRDLLTSGPVPANPFTFPTGDTKILVTYQGSKIQGLVASQSLCQASPVWKNFIYPPWGTQDAGVEDGIAAGPKSIDCSEDDGEALLVLMNIVHLEFQKIPKSLALGILHQVAMLCEQYQCVRIVAPWVQGWVKNIPKVAQFQLGMLYVYWAFGYEDEFQSSAILLVNNLTVSEEGQMKVGCYELTEDVLPPDILARILQLRERELTTSLTCMYTILDILERDDVICCEAEKPAELAGLNTTVVGDHSDCQVSLMVLGQWKETIFSNIALDCHLQHMRTQREKLGLTDTKSSPAPKKRKRSGIFA
ncbi:hypothetical protein ONS95_010859 [Cadophora gregata]|uniref:uncharacterized protein n=1 Tax=Cadophora gregata TaxID=51156 RepID=UPI0026DB7776|nr:uncharacterized protein ONS95_010859 [Cadophora gregata]KAK0119407.1 hypothetical protein ONS95_010859 [Cadophora gregata]